MSFRTVVGGLALLVGASWSQSSYAAVVLSDNFNSDTQLLNWTGDSVFTVVPNPPVQGQSSVDLIGTGGPFDFYPGNGNYVDLDGSTGSGNNPAGIVKSIGTFAAGQYTLTFDLGGNARGAPAQTTTIQLGSFIDNILLNSGDPFTLYTLNFTTNGGNLMFTDQGPSDQMGNILDNVTLTSTPIPAALPLFAGGLGMLTLFSRRKKRKELDTLAA
jgi:hypothetical protein